MSSVDASTATPIGVADYAARIGRALREAGPAVVEGEVQRPKQGGRGVWWFDLTDGEQVLPCSYLPWLTRAKAPSHAPKHGDRVRVRIRHCEYWAAGGRLRVVVEEVEAAGEGEMLRRRAELVGRLAAEGLCDPSAFPPLPRFPRGVGLISGAGSDALKDVIRGLGDRFPAVPVVTACCRVQGAAAPSEIVDRLARLDADPRVDVIVVARGGGSVQDLVCFDDERLCRAIRALRTPVVTAIGHTDNNPVCNHVTHAAFVPRHAAERVVPDRRELQREVAHVADALSRAARRPATLRRDLDAVATVVAHRGRLDRHRAAVLAGGRAVETHAARFLRAVDADLVAVRSLLDRGPDRVRSRNAAVRQALDARPIGVVAGRAATELRRAVAEHGRLLAAADPRRRGWIAALDERGQVVRRVGDLRPGATLRLSLEDGSATATVTDLLPDPRPSAAPIDRPSDGLSSEALPSAATVTDQPSAPPPATIVHRPAGSPPSAATAADQPSAPPPATIIDRPAGSPPSAATAADQPSDSLPSSRTPSPITDEMSA